MSCRRRGDQLGAQPAGRGPWGELRRGRRREPFRTVELVGEERDATLIAGADWPDPRVPGLHAASP